MSLGCPRCANALVGRRIHDVVVHECPECGGVFLDENAIGLLVDDPSQGRERATSLLAELPHRPQQATTGERKMYVKCPTCGTMMNRRLLAPKSGIVIDVCRSHGTFFDAGELTVLVQLVMQGALEQASRKTTERVPLKIQEDGLAKHVAIARTSQTRNASTGYADAGAAFVGLLFELLA